MTLIKVERNLKKAVRRDAKRIILEHILDMEYKEPKENYSDQDEFDDIMDNYYDRDDYDEEQHTDKNLYEPYKDYYDWFSNTQLEPIKHIEPRFDNPYWQE